jgi:hypothetical protein
MVEFTTPYFSHCSYFKVPTMALIVRAMCTNPITALIFFTRFFNCACKVFHINLIFSFVPMRERNLKCIWKLSNAHRSGGPRVVHHYRVLQAAVSTWRLYTPIPSGCATW